MGMARNSLISGIFKNHILAVTTGVVYVWFGFLKFMPDCSPAEQLAKQTIHVLTFGAIPDHVSIVLLAGWETLIGAMLLLNIGRRIAAGMALVHLLLTFTPFILFPEQTFAHPPLGYSLLGQYIAKNVILIAAMVTLWRQ